MNDFHYAANLHNMSDVGLSEYVFELKQIYDSMKRGAICETRLDVGRFSTSVYLERGMIFEAVHCQLAAAKKELDKRLEM